MTIVIDIDKINELELSPTEYCALFCLYYKEYKVLEQMTVGESFSWSNDSTFLGILPHLEHNNWLKITKYGDFKFQDIILREKAIKLFEVKSENVNDIKYAKLFCIYPIKVPDGNGGHRILKAKGNNSEDYKKGLEIWNRLIKKDSPDTIIKALETQLELTRHKLQYTQMFLVWLRQRTYEKYIGLIKPEDKDESI